MPVILALLFMATAVTAIDPCVSSALASPRSPLVIAERARLAGWALKGGEGHAKGESPPHPACFCSPAFAWPSCAMALPAAPASLFPGASGPLRALQRTGILDENLFPVHLDRRRDPSTDIYYCINYPARKPGLNSTPVISPRPLISPPRVGSTARPLISPLRVGSTARVAMTTTIGLLSAS